MLVSSEALAACEVTAATIETEPRRERRRSSKRLRETDHERELVCAARRGDARAFGKLVEMHRQRAIAVALRLLRDENDAEEVVQEAFLRAFCKIHRFDGESTFFTWLYRIVKNVALDLLRKPSHGDVDAYAERMPPLSHEDLLPSLARRIEGAEPFECVWRREVAGELEQALRALPPYHRDVIVMCAIDEMTYDEMARTVRVSRGTIMSRLFHARRKLRRALAGRHLGEVDWP